MFGNLLSLQRPRCCPAYFPSILRRVGSVLPPPPPTRISLCLVSVALRSIINQLNRCQCNGLPLSELPEKYRACLAAPLPAHRRGESLQKTREARAQRGLRRHEGCFLSFSHYQSYPGPEAKQGHCRLTGETPDSTKRPSLINN